MEARNKTAPSEFLLLGLRDGTELKPFIFILFLSMYLVTVLGNLLIMQAVAFHSHLHTPMYFFLSNLSFCGIHLITTTIPEMLVNLWTGDESITYTGCLSQVYFVLIFGGLENCLLAVMAYDRYVAICHPLKYMVIMNPHFCVLLALLCLLISIVHALLHTLMLLRLSFCADVEIPHFFCELAQLIKLSCSDILTNTLLVFSVSALFAGVPLSGIIFSYMHTVSSVLRMSSSMGKHKVFSTCDSHLSVVSLFYGTGFRVYISSAFTESPRKTAVASLMYSVVTQMLNRFIYSLRNRDMKKAFRKLIARTATPL